ncbi:acyl carrier protein [Lipomyces japonicus]|uniref:acyl carrier protein n=1 Tax=Lipomyces japonicus TaxID=56871 RepID=UPI0034CF8A47
MLRSFIRSIPARAVPATLVRPQFRPAVASRFYSAGHGLDRDEVQSRIFEVVKAFDKVTDPTKITASSTFANDLGLDSLDTVEVVMAIEEEFSIEIPDKEADEIKSVGQAIDYILAQSDAV